jgi:hypothetical protein
LRTGRLRLLQGRCPNLLREARLYRYPAAQEQAETELPLDRDNHALAALRYLVSRVDAAFLARLREHRPATEVANASRATGNEDNLWVRIV